MLRKISGSSFALDTCGVMGDEVNIVQKINTNGHIEAPHLEFGKETLNYLALSLLEQKEVSIDGIIRVVGVDGFREYAEEIAKTLLRLLRELTNESGHLFSEETFEKLSKIRGIIE